MVIDFARALNFKKMITNELLIFRSTQKNQKKICCVYIFN